MKREEFFYEFFKDRKNVLDIGCGEGFFLEHLKQNGIDAEGVDFSHEVSKKAADKGLKVTCGDAIEFAENKPEVYDGVYMSHMAEHLDFRQITALFSAVHKCLKPGGIFVVVTPDIKNLRDITDGFWNDPTHVRPYPIPALKQIFEKAGFAVIKAEEKKRPYDRLLWKLRDSIRRALVGDFWGRDELFVVGVKQDR